MAAQNVVTKIDGKVLTITIDLTKNLGPSASGKNNLIASTGGNMEIEGGAKGLKMGLNLFVPVKPA